MAENVKREAARGGGQAEGGGSRSGVWGVGGGGVGGAEAGWKTGLVGHVISEGNHLGPEMDANAVYAERFSTGEHEALAAVRERTRGALPERAHMLSGAVQGQLLGMLAALSNARRVLEVGCFTGYSALAVASALSEVL